MVCQLYRKHYGGEKKLLRFCSRYENKDTMPRAITIDLPEDVYSRHYKNRRKGNIANATTPLVPPRIRPSNNLGNYHTLWEVEEGGWEEVPQPPADPILLSHLGMGMYKVIAQWDLTELERKILEEYL